MLWNMEHGGIPRNVYIFEKVLMQAQDTFEYASDQSRVVKTAKKPLLYVPVSQNDPI